MTTTQQDARAEFDARYQQQMDKIAQRFKLESRSEISINIWDDYWDDGFVPEGETQTTYAYVEDSDIPQEFHKKALECLHQYLRDNTSLASDGVSMTIAFYDSADAYPNLVGSESEWVLYKRWQLNFENLTHARRDRLMEELSKAQLSCDGVPLSLMSES